MTSPWDYELRRKTRPCHAIFDYENIVLDGGRHAADVLLLEGTVGLKLKLLKCVLF